MEIFFLYQETEFSNRDDKMILSFSELWELCENLQKENSINNNSQNIINELNIKINLYRAIDLKQEIPEEDYKKIKSRLFGEILFTLTSLSFKDNINVFDALNTALINRK